MGSQIIRKRVKGTLPIPAINVNDSVTKSKLITNTVVKNLQLMLVRRATDIMLAGKRVIVLWLRCVGKGTAASFRGAGSIVTVTEIDPLNGRFG
jgi:adenosylhomocysteinase